MKPMDLDISPRTKAVILAGGLGTRLSEDRHQTQAHGRIGGRPILWHIMKHYSTYDVNDFVVCLGYKGYMIKEYFANYALHMPAMSPLISPMGQPVFIIVLPSRGG